MVNDGQWWLKMMTGWWCNNHLEKCEFVNGKDDIPYIMEDKKMFETTNQMKMIPSESGSKPTCSLFLTWVLKGIVHIRKVGLPLTTVFACPHRQYMIYMPAIFTYEYVSAIVGTNFDGKTVSQWIEWRISCSLQGNLVVLNGLEQRSRKRGLNSEGECFGKNLRWWFQY